MYEVNAGQFKGSLKRILKDLDRLIQFGYKPDIIHVNHTDYDKILEAIPPKKRREEISYRGKKLVSYSPNQST